MGLGSHPAPAGGGAQGGGGGDGSRIKALLLHVLLALLQLGTVIWALGARAGDLSSPSVYAAVGYRGRTDRTPSTDGTDEEPRQLLQEPQRPAHGHALGLNRAILPRGFRTFEEILEASKATKREHHFGHMYGEYLDPLRVSQAEVNMMEIGVQWGASMNLWLEAFPRGRVYGLEYNQLEFKQMDGGKQAQRAFFFRGDQANVTLLREIVARVRREVGQLDLIVDDGGHSMVQQITSFTHLFPLVKPGGVYFIEDLQTSYSTKCHKHWNGERYCYGGGPPGKKGTAIDMLKSLIDVLNSDFIEDHRDVNRLGSGKYSVNPADKHVGSVQCWRNMCAIRRKFEGSQF